MTLLDKKIHNIYYINLGHQYSVSFHSSPTWKTILKLEKCEFQMNGGYGHGLNSTAHSHIFLGGPEDIETIIDSKINPNPISSLKKVYFDKLCTYPRFKVNELTSIKRCLSPGKADSCIISKIPLDTYKWWEDGTKEIVLVSYSKQKDAYYFIANTSPFCDKNCLSFFNNKIAGISGKDTQHRLLSALISDGEIPSDTTPLYQGKIISLKQSTADYVNSIVNTYMKITYDTELDKFINTQLQPLTSTEAKEIDKMLKSSDDTVVGIGMKLLSNFDTESSSCTLGMLLLDNWNKIIDNTTFNSVGFQQMLKALKCDVGTLRYGNNKDKYINELYGNSTNSSDKAYAKDIIKAKILRELKKDVESYLETLNNFGFKITFSVE